MNVRAPLRRRLPGPARLAAVLVLAFGALWAGSGPALAAPTGLSVEQQVANVLQTNPGSVRINRTDVWLAPGMVMTVADPDSAKRAAATALPADCWLGYLCLYSDADFRGNLYRVESCGYKSLPGGINGVRDKVSSIYNHQYGSVVSRFYNKHGSKEELVGTLSAGNYLQALNLDPAADGGTWNDKIDEIFVC